MGHSIVSLLSEYIKVTYLPDIGLLEFVVYMTKWAVFRKFKMFQKGKIESVHLLRSEKLVKISNIL